MKEYVSFTFLLSVENLKYLNKRGKLFKNLLISLITFFYLSNSFESLRQLHLAYLD